LALGLVVAAVRNLRQGYKVNGRGPAFLVFLLLESPTLVYAGIIIGLIAGAYTLRHTEDDTRLWISTALGGVVLGVLFSALREVRHRLARLGLCLLLAVALGGGALAWLGQLQHVIPPEYMPDWLKSPFPEGIKPNLEVFAVQILL